MSGETHKELVDLAARWLRKKHSVVITEMVATGETPDAIGWRSWESTLIECKASHLDFLSDRDKHFRANPMRGMGDRRYFMAMTGVIQPNELPDGWGLLVVDAQRVTLAVESQPHDACKRAEVGLLLSALRRTAHDSPSNVSVQCYSIPTRNTATLGVEAMV